MDDMKKAQFAVTVLLTVWLVGIAVIIAVCDSVLGFWISVVWSLLVTLYAVISDYTENKKAAEHERIKAVYEAEMHAITERDEYWTKRGERK